MRKGAGWENSNLMAEVASEFPHLCWEHGIYLINELRQWHLIFYRFFKSIVYCRFRLVLKISFKFFNCFFKPLIKQLELMNLWFKIMDCPIEPTNSHTVSAPSPFCWGSNLPQIFAWGYSMFIVKKGWVKWNMALRAFFFQMSILACFSQTTN